MFGNKNKRIRELESEIEQLKKITTTEIEFRKDGMTVLLQNWLTMYSHARFSPARQYDVFTGKEVCDRETAKAAGVFNFILRVAK